MFNVIPPRPRGKSFVPAKCVFGPSALRTLGGVDTCWCMKYAKTPSAFLGRQPCKNKTVFLVFCVCVCLFVFVKARCKHKHKHKHKHNHNHTHTMRGVDTCWCMKYAKTPIAGTKVFSSWWPMVRKCVDPIRRLVKSGGSNWIQFFFAADPIFLLPGAADPILTRD